MLPRHSIKAMATPVTTIYVKGDPAKNKLLDCESVDVVTRSIWGCCMNPLERIASPCSSYCALPAVDSAAT